MIRRLIENNCFFLVMWLVVRLVLVQGCILIDFLSGAAQAFCDWFWRSTFGVNQGVHLPPDLIFYKIPGFTAWRATLCHRFPLFRVGHADGASRPAPCKICRLVPLPGASPTRRALGSSAQSRTCVFRRGPQFFLKQDPCVGLLLIGFLCLELWCFGAGTL